MTDGETLDWLETPMLVRMRVVAKRKLEDPSTRAADRQRNEQLVAEIDRLLARRKEGSG